MAEKYRIQFDFTAEAFRELETLKTSVHANSRAEVVRYALRVLQWTIEQLDAGARILVEREGRSQEVVFPFLPARTEAKSQTAARK